MKNTNPLTLLLGAVVILAIAVYSLDSAKKNLEDKKSEFNQYKQIATIFQTHANSFSNKKQITKKLQKIIKSSGISNANIMDKNKKITLQIASVNIKQVDKFINKLMNENFNITKLDISKNKIVVEIGVI